ncbi:MAG TPA: HAD family hydrolase [Anaeromyxobacteraceae bacterium]|nr:HAD family hydrolase [Anaeromyxobacteraceae bacterium]
MARGILFDTDGTLVDSVDLQVQSWRESFAHFGKEVSCEAIRSQLGKGGAELILDFLSEGERGRFGEDLYEHQSDVYQQKYLPRAQAFPQARALLARLKQSGALVGLATSCRRRELGHYLRLVGGASLVDAVVDAEQTTPSKDAFRSCLGRLGLRPSQAVAVGDSPFDIESAGRAKVAAVGVLCGGYPEQDLRSAGCIAVYQDVAELLSGLASSPLLLGPSPQR